MKFRRVIFLLYSVFIKYNLVYSLDVLQLQELTTGLHNLSNIKILEENVENKPVEISQYKFGFTNTVISVDNIVNELDQRASCDARYWNNKLENACKCCLIQNAPKLDIGKKPSEILKICLDKNQCNNGVIQALLNQEKIESKDNEEKIRELIYHIYNKSVIVKEVFPHDIKFNADGTLTESAVKELLVQGYKEGKLRDPNFSSISCLDAKNILSEKGTGTDQLFSITSNCLGKENDFILKDLLKGSSEIIELQKTSLIPRLNNYIYPKNVLRFPSFVFPFAYISYNFGGKEHYLSLMMKASGVPLSLLTKEYKNNSINKSDVELAYYKTGFAFSNFHQKFMKNFKQLAKPGQLLNLTYVQGDAHQSNIFYDKDTNRVIFIDNEKFSSQKNPFEDIEVFIFRSLIFIPPALFVDQKFLHDWIFLSTLSFLKGYIEAYKINDRIKILEELMVKFSTESSYIHEFFTYYDEYKRYEHIFDKIFEELKKIYNT